ncbi:MAG TPA: hypothetical protein VFR32_04760 [Gaiellaceae bacterium]|nr:hypothetical protein [Gaiellaceae bacterium]
MSRAADSGLPHVRNRAATSSVALGLAAVLVVPAAIAASRYVEALSLVWSCASAALAALLGALAVAQARRARETVQRTLARSGGEGAARAGRILGVVGLWIAATTGLALAFYGLLTVLAD